MTSQNPNQYPNLALNQSQPIYVAQAQPQQFQGQPSSVPVTMIPQYGAQPQQMMISSRPQNQGASQLVNQVPVYQIVNPVFESQSHTDSMHRISKLALRENVNSCKCFFSCCTACIFLAAFINIINALVYYGMSTLDQEWEMYDEISGTYIRLQIPSQGISLMYFVSAMSAIVFSLMCAKGIKLENNMENYYFMNQQVQDVPSSFKTQEHIAYIRSVTKILAIMQIVQSIQACYLANYFLQTLLEDNREFLNYYMEDEAQKNDQQPDMDDFVDGINAFLIIVVFFGTLFNFAILYFINILCITKHYKGLMYHQINIEKYPQSN